MADNNVPDDGLEPKDDSAPPTDPPERGSGNEPTPEPNPAPPPAKSPASPANAEGFSTGAAIALVIVLLAIAGVSLWLAVKTWQHRRSA